VGWLSRGTSAGSGGLITDFEGKEKLGAWRINGETQGGLGAGATNQKDVSFSKGQNPGRLLGW